MACNGWSSERRQVDGATHSFASAALPLKPSHKVECSTPQREFWVLYKQHCLDCFARRYNVLETFRARRVCSTFVHICPYAENPFSRSCDLEMSVQDGSVADSASQHAGKAPILLGV